MTAARYKAVQRVLTVIAAVSLAVAVPASFLKGALPDAAAIAPELLAEPVQNEIIESHFAHELNGRTYHIQPVATYDIAALVVSHNMAIRGMINFAAKTDEIDTPDLGVIWGSNLRSNDFHRVKFWSGTFTLNFLYPSDVNFDPYGAGNVHIVAATPEVYSRAVGINVGDQIRLRGRLINYSRQDLGPYVRRSSLVRNDTGNGACEVMLVEDVQVLRAGTPLWHMLYGFTLLTLVLSVTGKLGLFVFSIVRPPQKTPAIAAVEVAVPVQPQAEPPARSSYEQEPWNRR